LPSGPTQSFRFEVSYETLYDMTKRHGWVDEAHEVPWLHTLRVACVGTLRLWSDSEHMVRMLEGTYPADQREVVGPILAELAEIERGRVVTS